MLRHLLGIPLLLLIVPLSAAYAQVDPLTVIVTNDIHSDGVVYPILPDVQIEESGITGIIRIHGHIVTGDPFAIYLKSYDPTFQYVTLLQDGHFQKATLKSIERASITPTESVQEPTVINPSQPEMDFDYFISSPIFVQEDFTISLKSFDSQQGMTNLPTNGIPGTKFKVTLAQEDTETVTVDDKNSYEKVIEDDWNTLAEIEGTSNQYGSWTGAKLLTSGVFEPKRWMNVTVTATLGDQVVEKSQRVFVSEVGSK